MRGPSSFVQVLKQGVETGGVPPNVRLALFFQSVTFSGLRIVEGNTTIVLEPTVNYCDQEF